MKKTLVFFAAILIATGSFAQANKGKGKTAAAKASPFKKSAAGVEYLIAKDVPGGNTPKTNDVIECHVVVLVQDSIVQESRKQMNGSPVQFKLTEPKTDYGDMMSVLMLMTPGDSAVLRISLDTFRAKSPGQIPEWIKPGAMQEYRIALVGIKSEEQVQKEQQEKMAEQQKLAAEQAIKQGPIDDQLLQDYFKKNNIKATKTASGLYYTIITPGSGPNPQVGQQMTMNYTGKTMDGESFDSNVDPKFNHVQPFQFALGQHAVIAGWDEGIALLKKGAKAMLYIPSAMAYGPAGRMPTIAPNAILIFEVELVDFK